jgi:hypothetical protein
MASKVQTTGSVVNFADLRAGEPYAVDSQTFLTDAGRATDLVAGTVVSQDPATEKWVPLTDATATDGTEIPSGVILETIEAADLVAGDVTGISVCIGGSGVVFREGFLTLENSLTFATELTNQNKTIERALRDISIYPQATLAIEWLQS